MQQPQTNNHQYSEPNYNPNSRISSGMSNLPGHHSNLSTASSGTRLFLMTVGLLVLALVAVPLYSNSVTMADNTATMSVKGGSVDVLHDGDDSVVTVHDNSRTSLGTNDMVNTISGTATVQFFEEHRVNISPNSKFSIERYEATEAGNRLGYMVWAGQVVHEAQESSHGTDWAQISTPSSNVAVRDGVVAINVISPEETQYEVIEGIAWVTMGEKEYFLAPAEELAATMQVPLSEENADVSAASRVDRLPDPSSVAGHSSQPTVASAKTVADLLPTTPQSIVIEGETPSSHASIVHVVEAGDTFWSIATQYELSVGELANANPEMADLPFLSIGHSVTIPTSLN